MYKRNSESKHLGFSKSYDSRSQRKTRSRNQLIAWRKRLQTACELKFDDNTGIIYHKDSSVDDCTPVEGIDYSENEESNLIYSEVKKPKLTSTISKNDSEENEFNRTIENDSKGKNCKHSYCE